LVSCEFVDMSFHTSSRTRPCGIPGCGQKILVTLINWFKSSIIHWLTKSTLV
jgi:hypothetical protein